MADEKTAAAGDVPRAGAAGGAPRGSDGDPGAPGRLPAAQGVDPEAPGVDAEARAGAPEGSAGAPRTEGAAPDPDRGDGSVASAKPAAAAPPSKVLEWTVAIALMLFVVLVFVAFMGLFRQ